MGYVSGLRIQLRVIGALLLRETIVRAGKQNLGFLWVLLEPLAYVSLTIGLYLFAGKRPHSGMPLVPFFISGFMPFLAFRNAALRVMQAAVSNGAILMYPQVKVFDIIIARSLLEGAISIMVTFILIFVMMAFDLGEPPANPLGVIAMIWYGIFAGMSLGATLSVMNQFTRETEQIFKPVLRVLVFFSGVFFLADDLPRMLHVVAAYNPVFHLIQASREYYFTNIRDYSDLTFVFLCFLPFLFFGMLMERMTTRSSLSD